MPVPMGIRFLLPRTHRGLSGVIAVGGPVRTPTKYVIVTGAILLAVATLAVWIAEVALRTADRPSPISSGWGWAQSPRRNIAPPEDSGQNELGLRGRPFLYGAQDAVVLLLGDSQVEATTSRPEFMPEQLLEAHLGQAALPRPVKVFSLASSGWGNDQQLLALEHYFQTHRADVVLVWATPQNDFWENSFPDRNTTAIAGHIKPTFLLNSTGLKGPFLFGDVYLSRSRVMEIILRAWLRLTGRTKEQYLLDQWVQQLPLAVRRPVEEAAARCLSYPIVAQKEFFENIFRLPADRGVTLHTKEDVENSRSHFSPFIEPRSERDQYLINITRALLDRIKRVVTDHGAVFRVIYPVRREFDQLAKESLRCIETETGRQFAARFESLALLKSVVDVDDLITFPLPGGEELSVSPDDRHLSDYGNDRAMQALAQEFVRRDFIRR